MSGGVLPDELNHFYGSCDRDNKEVAIKAVLHADRQPLTLPTNDVHAALSRVSAWKAAGPWVLQNHLHRASAETLHCIEP